MKILINASQVGYGGGLIVTQNLLITATQFHNHDFFVFIPSKSIIKLTDNFYYEFTPNIFLKKITRFFFEYFWLPQNIKRINPDIVLTLNNLPSITKYHQIYYLQNAFLVSKSLKKYNLTFYEIASNVIKRFIFKRRLKYVNILLTQTQYIKKCFIRNFYFFTGKIITVPNNLPLLPQVHISFPTLKTAKRKILILSRYYSHKNLEIIFKILLTKKFHGLNYLFITTIDKSDHPRAKKFIQTIEKIHSVSIINLGYINPQFIHSLFQHIDIVLLPSLIESSSITYLEAMKYKKPILTSDRTFAHEILQDAGWYFNPFSPEEILETINNCFSNKRERIKKINRGYEIVNQLPGWNKIFEDIINLERK